MLQALPKVAVEINALESALDGAHALLAAVSTVRNVIGDEVCPDTPGERDSDALALDDSGLGTTPLRANRRQVSGPSHTLRHTAFLYSNFCSLYQCRLCHNLARDLVVVRS